jgi:uncharacterized protein YndB with AHSA1/START domain
MRKAKSIRKRPEREIVLTRVFDAPRALVYQAWTDPIHLAEWWGPKKFTNPVCELDLKAGGALRIVMRGPQGTEYPMSGVFREIVPLERLVFTWVAEDVKGKPLAKGLTTVTFEDSGRKTQLTLQTSGVGLAPIAGQMLEGMKAGWSQSLDKLRGHVTDTANRLLGTSRIINAPRERVFKAWADPKILAEWWGPTGFKNTFEEFDLRPGGTWKFVMHGPDGRNYRNQSVFVEVAKPERISLDHLSWPNFRLQARFEKAGRRTKVIWRMLFDSAADCQKVKGFAPDGIEQNLDRLSAQLAKRG